VSWSSSKAKDLEDAIGQFVLQQEIVTENPLDARHGESRLLLFLDGLDELAMQANLSGARLERANLQHANLEGAHLKNAKVSEEQLRQTRGTPASR
jgi:uncharacterized protein YjbI with pentapeptide repeats